MGLLSSNITSRKKLSLKDAKIAPEERVLMITEPLKDVERPIGEEDIAYTKLLDKNPLLDKLIDTFDLVSKATGEKLRKAPGDPKETPQQELRVIEEAKDRRPAKKPVEPLKKPQNNKLLSLATKILQEEDSLSKEEIITRLQEETDVNQGRAEVGFNMMLETGLVIQINQLNKYYLQGSTPF